MQEQNLDKNKYDKKLIVNKRGYIDTYCVNLMFGVTCPAKAHAIKKLLSSGTRGVKDAKQDVREAIEELEHHLYFLSNELPPMPEITDEDKEGLVDIPDKVGYDWRETGVKVNTQEKFAIVKDALNHPQKWEIYGSETVLYGDGTSAMEGSGYDDNYNTITFEEFTSIIEPK